MPIMVELDPGRRELEERLNALQSLKRKYGPKLDQVMAFGENASNRSSSSSSNAMGKGRVCRMKSAKPTRRALGSRTAIVRQRQRAIPRFNRAVTRQLRDLGFHQSQFDVQLAS